MPTPLLDPVSKLPYEESALRGLTTKELQPMLRKATGVSGPIGAWASAQDCIDILTGVTTIDDYEVCQSVATNWKTSVMKRGATARLPSAFASAVEAVETPTAVAVSDADLNTADNIMDDVVKRLRAFSPPMGDQLANAKQTFLTKASAIERQLSSLQVEFEKAKANATQAAELVAIAPPVQAKDLGNGFIDIMGIQMPIILKPGDPGYEWVPALDLKFDPKSWNAETRLSNGSKSTYDSDITVLIKLLLAGAPVHLYGVPSVGKTEALKFIAASCGWPMILMTGKKNFDEALFFGSYQAAPGKGTFWQDGLLPIAMKIGAIFLANEVDYFSANATNTLNPILDTLITNITRPVAEKVAPRLVIPEASLVVSAHPNFRFAADSNTNLQGDDTGLYVGTQVQNAAFMSRILVSLRIHYMSAANEIKLLQSKAGIPKDTAKLIVKVATETRNAAEKETIRYPLTHRHTLAWATMIHILGDIEAAFVMTVVNKMGPADSAVIMEIAQRVLGDKLPNLFPNSKAVEVTEAGPAPSY